MRDREIGELTRTWASQSELNIFETWSDYHDVVNALGQVDMGQIGYLGQKFLIGNIMYKEG